MTHLLDRAQDQADRVHLRSFAKKKQAHAVFAQRNMRSAFAQGKSDHAESVADRLMALIEEFGINLHSKFSFKLERAPLGFLNQDSQVLTSFGKFAVPPAFSCVLPSNKHFPTYSASNRARVGIPVRIITTFKEFYVASGLSKLFYYHAKMGSDYPNSVIAPIEENVVKEKRFRGHARESKTKASKKAKIVPEKKQRVSNDLNVFTEKTTNAEILAVWKAYRQRNMRLRGIFHAMYNVWHSLSRYEPRIDTRKLSDTEVRILKRLVEFQLQNGLTAPPGHAELEPIVATLVVDTHPYTIRVPQNSIFFKIQKNPRDNLIELRNVIERKIAVGHWSIEGNSQKKVRWSIEGRVFVSDSLRQTLYQMGIELRYEHLVAMSGLTGLTTIMESFKMVFEQAAEFMRDYPVISDLASFLLFYGICKITGLESSFVVSFFASWLIRPIVLSLVDTTLRDEKESMVPPPGNIPPVQGPINIDGEGFEAFADVFSLSTAFKNAVAAILGKHFDEKRLEEDAKVARSFVTFFAFGSAVYRLGAAAISLMATFLPWLYTKVTGKPWSKDDLQAVLERHSKAINLVTLHLSRKLSLSPSELAENTQVLFASLTEIPATFNRHDSLRRETLKLIEQLHTRLMSCEFPGSRPVPVHVLMSGPPGKGKTTAAIPLMRAFNSSYGVAYNSIYFPTVTSQYHENYEGQHCTLLDDQGQAKDESLSQQLALQLFFMIGPSPYYMDAAAIEKKTNTLFQSNLVVTTTNLSAEALAEDVKVREAFLRRVHLNIDVHEKGEKELDTKFLVRSTSAYLDRVAHFLSDDMKLNDDYVVPFPILVKMICFIKDLHQKEHDSFFHQSEEFTKLYPAAPSPDSVQALMDKMVPGQEPQARGAIKVDLEEEDLLNHFTSQSCCNKFGAKLKNFFLSPYRAYCWFQQLRESAARAAAITIALMKVIIVALVGLCIALVIFLVRWGYEKFRDYFAKDEPVTEVPVDSYGYVHRYSEKRPAVRSVEALARSRVDPELAKISNAMVRVSIGEETHYGIMLKSRKMLITTHILRQQDQRSPLIVDLQKDQALSYRFTLQNLKIRERVDQDLAVVTLNTKDDEGQFFPEFPDILHFFVSNHTFLGTHALSLWVMSYAGPHNWVSCYVSGKLSLHSYKHKRGEPKEFVTTTIPVTVKARAGDCIAPLVAQNNLGNGCILGVLVAGTNDSAYYAPAPRDLLEYMCSDQEIQALGYTRQEGYAPGDNPSRKLLQDHLTRHDKPYYVLDDKGKQIQFGTICTRTKYEPNPRADEELRLREAPAPMRQTIELPDGTVLHPLSIALHKLDMGKPIESAAIAQLLTDEYYVFIKSIIGEVKLSPLPPEQAFKGVPEYGIPGFNGSSAAGWIEGRNRKVQECLENEEIPPYMYESLNLFRVRPDLFPAVMSKKDEILPIEKVQEGKIRLFFGVNAIQNWDAKIMFAPLWARMREFGQAHGFMVGTPFGVFTECEHLAREHFSHAGYSLVQGDISGFQRTRHKIQWTARRDAIKRFYDPVHHADIDRIYEANYNPHVALGKQCFQLHDILLSGNNETAEANTLDVLVAIRFCARMRGAIDDLKRLYAYGDDFTGVVSENAKISNWTLREDFARYFGWALTPPDKSENYPRYYTLLEFSFCKRFFSSSGALVRPYSELQLAGGWKKKNPYMDTALQAIHSSLTEAKRYYDRGATYDKLMAYFKEHTNYTSTELGEFVALGGKTKRRGVFKRTTLLSEPHRDEPFPAVTTVPREPPSQQVPPTMRQRLTKAEKKKKAREDKAAHETVLPLLPSSGPEQVKDLLDFDQVVSPPVASSSFAWLSSSESSHSSSSELETISLGDDETWPLPPRQTPIESFGDIDLDSFPFYTFPDDSGSESDEPDESENQLPVMPDGEQSLILYCEPVPLSNEERKPRAFAAARPGFFDFIEHDSFTQMKTSELLREVQDQIQKDDPFTHASGLFRGCVLDPVFTARLLYNHWNSFPVKFNGRYYVIPLPICVTLTSTTWPGKPSLNTRFGVSNFWPSTTLGTFSIVFLDDNLPNQTPKQFLQRAFPGTEISARHYAWMYLAFQNLGIYARQMEDFIREGTDFEQLCRNVANPYVRVFVQLSRVGLMHLFTKQLIPVEPRKIQFPVLSYKKMVSSREIFVRPTGKPVPVRTWLHLQEGVPDPKLTETPVANLDYDFGFFPHLRDSPKVMQTGSEVPLFLLPSKPLDPRVAVALMNRYHPEFTFCFHTALVEAMWLNHWAPSTAFEIVETFPLTPIERLQMFLGWYGHTILANMTFTERCTEEFYVLLSSASTYIDEILYHASRFIGTYQEFCILLIKKIAGLAKYINPARLWRASDESRG